MSALIAAEELGRLQKRMGRLMEEMGLSSLESRYLEEMQRMQKRMGDLVEAIEPRTTIPDLMRPLADLKETDGEMIATMDLPGIDKKDVDITIAEGELSVKAERKTESESEEKNYHRRERTYSRFERRLSIPTGVKIDEARACLDDGVLTITIPKEVVTTRKRIEIE